METVNLTLTSVSHEPLHSNDIYSPTQIGVKKTQRSCWELCISFNSLFKVPTLYIWNDYNLWNLTFHSATSYLFTSYVVKFVYLCQFTPHTNLSSFSHLPSIVIWITSSICPVKLPPKFPQSLKSFKFRTNSL